MRGPNPCVTFLCAVAAAAAFGVAGARADGLPVLGIDVGGTGVASSSGDVRYVAMPAGRDTVLARVNPSGGRVLDSTLLRGTFTIPAVAYDASAGGLSHDGKTLVLIEPRVGFPRTRTALMVIDMRHLLLRPRKVISLKGDFSFDAVSPHGSLLYLIQYVSRFDPTVYRVRVYDVGAGKLLAGTVTDPRERGQKMHGSPQTRATSPDGRWAYTLYDGAGKMPFVHALDTSTRSARCIDLPTLAGTVLSGLRLRVDRDGTLTVINRRLPVLVVDTRTFQTTVPGPAPTGIPWLLVALSILGAFAAAGALWLALRRRGASLTRPRPRTPVRAS
jgi:hypothetical protein